jgi:RNA polymerase sigma factor (sigma-70 family)
MLSASMVRPTDTGLHPDTELLARLMEGDSGALRAAYAAYSSLVFGLARRVTASAAAAEDITQEVFLHLWERPDAVDLTRGSLRSYLGVIAHRRAVDAVRRTSRARTRDERASWDSGTASLGHEGAVVEHDEQARRTRQLRDAIGKLPADQRRALELAYFGDRTYREVATELGIPEGTAKSRLRLAIAKLRDLIDAPERLAQA